MLKCILPRKSANLKSDGRRQAVVNGRMLGWLFVVSRDG